MKPDHKGESVDACRISHLPNGHLYWGFLLYIIVFLHARNYLGVKYLNKREKYTKNYLQIQTKTKENI